MAGGPEILVLKESGNANFSVGIFYRLMHIIYNFEDDKDCWIILLVESFNIYVFIIYF